MSEEGIMHFMGHERISYMSLRKMFSYSDNNNPQLVKSSRIEEAFEYTDIRV